MSEENKSLSENPSVLEAGSTPKARRVSTPRPKKTAKPKNPPVDLASALPEIDSIPYPSAPEGITREDVAEEPPVAGGEWPEPEAPSTGGSTTPSESPKRKRRRRKGKGQQCGGTEETQSPPASEAKQGEPTLDPRPPRPNPGPQAQQPQRAKVDPELLTKMAWKIYLAEVSEEGVALIGDNDAKDLSRRCFRLAEIFIEEQARRR